ncbi:MAG: hypothetical protein ACR2JC_01825 [Chloroflexota bacterium]
MRHLFSRLRERAIAHRLNGTTFCDGCRAICTSTCRHDARLRHYRETLQRDGLIRF